MGGIAATMFAGVTALALISDVKYVEHACDLVGFPNCETEPQRTVIAQLAAATFGGDSSIGFFYIQAATALVLVLAANTAFNGFPLLGSVLAQDRFLPRQLHTRGDKLVYSNGILLLAGFAVPADLRLRRRRHPADPALHHRRLHQLHASASGAWSGTGTGSCASSATRRSRRRMRRSQIINAVGGSLTSVVLVIIVITKFTHGAWLVLVAMPILFVLMKAINRHYSNVAEQLVPDSDSRMLPSKVHAIVLVSKVHKPTLRALAFARATRPDHLTALTVNVDDAETRALQADWERYDLPVPLTVARVAVPGDHPAGRRLREGHPPRQPPGDRRGVRPAVRRRPLVGERPAQPERAAAARPAAVPARRHDHHRAVAAGELGRPRRRRRRRARPGDLRRGSPTTSRRPRPYG